MKVIFPVWASVDHIQQLWFIRIIHVENILFFSDLAANLRNVGKTLTGIYESHWYTVTTIPPAQGKLKLQHSYCSVFTTSPRSHSRRIEEHIIDIYMHICLYTFLKCISWIYYETHIPSQLITWPRPHIHKYPLHYVKAVISGVMLGLGRISIVRVSDDLPSLYEDLARGTSSWEPTCMSFWSWGFVDFHTEPPGLMQLWTQN